MTNLNNLTERLERCYTGVVHDVMRAMGLRDFTLDAGLKPLIPGQAMAGTAFTISGKVAKSADAHQTLLAWTGLLSRAPSGSIWVSQPNDTEVAHMGELSAETLKNKGVRGCVVDGLIRDTSFLIDIGFQAYSRGHTPRDVVGHWLPDSVNVPITVAGVVVVPGDFIVADRDGVIRVPQDRIVEVVENAETAIGTENLVRKAILASEDPQEAYLTYGKF